METRPMMHTSRRPMKRSIQSLIVVLGFAALNSQSAYANFVDSCPSGQHSVAISINSHYPSGFACTTNLDVAGVPTGQALSLMQACYPFSDATYTYVVDSISFGTAFWGLNISRTFNSNGASAGSSRSNLASQCIEGDLPPPPPVCPSTTTATDFGFQSTNNGCYQNDAGCRIEPLDPNDSDVREVCIVDPNTGFASICTQGFDDATAPTPWRQSGGDCGNPDPNAEHELFAPYEERIEVDGQDNITPSNNPNCSEINGVQVCVGDSGCVNLPSGRTYCPPGVTPPQTDSEGEPIEYEQEGAWRTSTPNGDGTATESGGTINRNISGGNTGGGGDGNGDGGGTGGTGGNGDGDGDGEGECDPATEQCGDGTISGGGNCDNAPNCDGPPIECFIADQSWRTNCALTSSQEDINDALSAGLGTENDEGLIPVVGEVNVAEWFSSATSTSSGGCFSDVVIPISAMDTTLTLPLSMGCGLFDIIRFMLLAAASLWGLRHVAEAI